MPCSQAARQPGWGRGRAGGRAGRGADGRLELGGQVINFLLTTEIIPLCLRIMETGSELSKTVATFIVQKILLDDMGLQVLTLNPKT